MTTEEALKPISKRALCDAIRNSRVRHPTRLTAQDRVDLVDMVDRTRRAHGEDWFEGFLESCRREQEYQRTRKQSQ